MADPREQTDTGRERLARVLHEVMCSDGWQVQTWDETTVAHQHNHGFQADRLIAANVTLAPDDRLREALEAGDALNVAGGSRNAGAAGPERDQRTRAEWFAASSRWHEVSGRLRAALTEAPSPGAGERGLDVERLQEELGWAAVMVRDLVREGWSYGSQRRALDWADAIETAAGYVAHEARLDAAWAEAEAALPEGWYISELLAPLRISGSQWSAIAAPPSVDGPESVFGHGPTAAAALHALAAKLRAALPPSPSNPAAEPERETPELDVERLTWALYNLRSEEPPDDWEEAGRLVAGEYGRLLAERDRLIAAGYDPADLDVPDAPTGPAGIDREAGQP